MRAVQRIFASSIGKFAIVGVANNIIGYLIFVILSLSGTSAIPAMVVSYCTGMFISFFGNRSFTFGHQGRNREAILRFIVVNAVGLALNAAILWLFVDKIGFPQIPVQLLAIGCVAVFTFTLMRAWVFQNRAKESELSHE